MVLVLKHEQGKLLMPDPLFDYTCKPPPATAPLHSRAVDGLCRGVFCSHGESDGAVAYPTPAAPGGSSEVDLVSYPQV